MPNPTGDTLDFSGTEMYLRCGEQYRRRYILGESDPPGIARVEGSAYHAALALANRTKRDKGTTTPPRKMIDVFMHELELGTDKKRVGKVNWEDENKNSLHKRAKVLFPEYARVVDPTIDPDWVEQPVMREITVGGSTFKLAGILDLTTKKGKQKLSGAVVDYKTSKAAKTQAEVDESLQLSIYSGATQLSNVAYINFVKTKTPYIQVLVGKRTPADLAWSQQVTERVYRSIKAGIFPFADPNPRNWWCSEKFCGYWGSCRGKYVKLRNQELVSA